MIACRYCKTAYWEADQCPACLTPRFVEFALLEELTAGEVRYGRAIRNAVRALLDGEISFFAFTDSMIRTVREGIRSAYLEGAKMSGLSPADLTPAENREIQTLIHASITQVLSLSADIARRRDRLHFAPEERAKHFAQLMNRVTLWDARYEQARSQGLATTAKDQKLEWVWDPAKEHCSSCGRLNGKVRRASWWRENGILPQVPGAWYLKCGGWKCGCRLRPTDKPQSKGRMPNLP